MNATIGLLAAASLTLVGRADADVIFSHVGPDTLAGGVSVTVFSGSASGSLGLFTWSFDYGEPITDTSWASDMAIDITDPSGGTVRIEGFDTTGLISIYHGVLSDAPGHYGDGFDLSGFALSGSGIWTVTVTNDFLFDSSPNTIGGFVGSLGGLVPAPGVLGLFGIFGLASAHRRR